MYNNGKIDLVDHVQSSDFKSYFNTLPPLFPQTTILSLTYCKISQGSISQFAMVNALASYRYNLNLIMCETIWWSPAWARGILRAPRLAPNHWLPCANIRAHEACLSIIVLKLKKISLSIQNNIQICRFIMYHISMNHYHLNICSELYCKHCISMNPSKGSIRSVPWVI